jgi:hypothetical protein
MKKMTHEHHMKMASKKMKEAEMHHKKAHDAMKHMDKKEDMAMMKKVIKKGCMK